MADRRVTLAAIALFAFSLYSVIPEEQGPREEDAVENTTGADWLPPGSVSPAVERHALEIQARLQTGIPSFQREALFSIRSGLANGDRNEMRIATVPLVIDLLDEEYRILEFPRDYRVDETTRLVALEVLAEVGGAAARSQIRISVTDDDDATIRAEAARLLATYPGDTPEEDLSAVSRALLRSVHRGGSTAEVYRLVGAARELSVRVWDPSNPELLDALVLIAGGGYSASLRSAAISLLEELADR
ncbi:MAG: hypothetical protein ACLFR8_10345 [Alkalispirochaeta sp.]